MLTDFRCYVSLQEALSKHSHLDLGRSSARNWQDKQKVIFSIGGT
jgi:hypothetical protein